MCWTSSIWLTPLALFFSGTSIWAVRWYSVLFGFWTFLYVVCLLLSWHWYMLSSSHSHLIFYIILCQFFIYYPSCHSFLCAGLRYSSTMTCIIHCSIFYYGCIVVRHSIISLRSKIKFLLMMGIWWNYYSIIRPEGRVSATRSVGPHRLHIGLSPEPRAAWAFALRTEWLI